MTEEENTKDKAVVMKNINEKCREEQIKEIKTDRRE